MSKLPAGYQGADVLVAKFKAEHKEKGRIVTTVTERNYEKGYAEVRAEIYLDDRLIATAHSATTEFGEDKELEKAESAAVRRALINFGYLGVDVTAEEDEEEEKEERSSGNRFKRKSKARDEEESEEEEETEEEEEETQAASAADEEEAEDEEEEKAPPKAASESKKEEAPPASKPTSSKVQDLMNKYARKPSNGAGANVRR